MNEDYKIYNGNGYNSKKWYVEKNNIIVEVFNHELDAKRYIKEKEEKKCSCPEGYHDVFVECRGY